MYSKELRLKTNSNPTQVNRTLKYLVPALRSNGGKFVNLMQLLYWNAHGIIDFAYDDDISQPRIFSLTNIKNSHNFEKFRQFCRDTELLLDEYPFSPTQHMFVFKFPFTEAYQKFLEGKYSQMYTPQQVNSFIPKSYYGPDGVLQFTEVYSIITKRSAYFEEFQSKIYDDFGIYIPEDDRDEYDYPPLINEESFNYNKLNNKNGILVHTDKRKE